MTIEQFKKKIPELNKRIDEETYGYGFMYFCIRGNGLVFAYSSDSFSQKVAEVFLKWLKDNVVDLEESVSMEDTNIHWACVISGVWSEKGYAVEEEWVMHDKEVA